MSRLAPTGVTCPTNAGVSQCEPPPWPQMMKESNDGAVETVRQAPTSARAVLGVRLSASLEVCQFAGNHGEAMRTGEDAPAAG